MRGLCLFALVLMASMFVGCGGGSGVPSVLPTPTPTPSPTPTPTPVPLTASNADLNGSYAISLIGNNPAIAGGSFFGIIGSIHANGTGVIDTGELDLEIDGTPGLHTHQINVTGTYNIGPNALGSAILNTVNGPLNLELVMASKTHGQVTIFQNGSGAATGSIDLQTPADFSLASFEGASFVFNALSTDPNHPHGLAGNFVVDATGNFSSGTFDFNDNGTISANTPLSGGFVLAPDSGGFGFTSIQFRNAANLITGLQLTYVIIDKTHMLVLESEGVGFAAGEMFTRAQIPVAAPNTAISGPFVLTAHGPTNFALGAVLVATPSQGSSTNGTISGTGDLNSSAVVQNANVTGTYSIASNGRGTMTISVGAVARQFAVYPSSGGIQFFEIDSLGPANGGAVQQSAGPFSQASIDGYFAAAFASQNTSGGVGCIIHFTSTAGVMTGEDFFINSSGVTSKGSGSFSGSSIVVGSSGRADVTLPLPGTPSNTAHFVFYLVDPTKMLFIQTDAGQAGTGIIHQQQQSQL